MGYYIQALIGKTDYLTNRQEHFPSEFQVTLAQDLTLILATEDLLEEISDGFPVEVENETKGFSMLTGSLSAWAKQISILTPVAYIEAEYFGGTGAQSAVVWDKTEIKFGPVTAEIGPINQALKYLGAKVLSAHDEFEAVGLNQAGNMDDWIDLSNDAK